MPILGDMRPVRTRPNGEQLSCAVLQRIVPSLGNFRRYGKRWVVRSFPYGSTLTTKLLPGFSLLIDPRK